MLLKIDDPLSVEIQEQWMDFLEEIYTTLPRNATALSIGSVMAFLLAEYKPPMEELIPVVETVLTTYHDLHQKNNRLN